MVGLSFFVPGTPVTQGSMRIYNHRIVHTKAEQMKAWRTKINQIASVKHTGEPINEAVKVTALFLLPRPKYLAQKLSEPADKKPDLDKLQRAIGDALSPRNGSRILFDDSRITEWHTYKRYVQPGEEPGVYIKIEQETVDD